jgi:hypothetical protein
MHKKKIKIIEREEEGSKKKMNYLMGLFLI